MTTEEDQLMSGIERVKKEAGGFELTKIENYIASHPEDVMGYAAKAAILGSTRDYNKAHASLTEAQKKFPDNGILHHVAATIYENEGKREEAIKESRTALKLNPYSPEIRITFGTLLNRAGRYDEAIAAWQGILKIDPRLSMAWNSLAKSEFEKGEYRKAINHSTAAVMLAEGTQLEYIFLQNRSQIYLASGNLEAALEDDARVLQHDPNVGVKHIISQPDFLMKRGKVPEALKYSQSALEKFPILRQFIEGVRR